MAGTVGAHGGEGHGHNDLVLVDSELLLISYLLTCRVPVKHENVSYLASKNQEFQE